MAEIVRMPKMSDTMTEGVISKWHKKVGDQVKTGELIAEVETDKATMDFESYQEGTVLYIGAEEGKSVPVDGIIAIFGKAGEDFKALLASDVAAEKPVSAAPAVQEAPKPIEKAVEIKEVKAPAVVAASAPIATESNTDGRMKVSPLAKKLAGDKGIDLHKVIGSGEHGRIVKRDIDWFKPGMAVNSSMTGFSSVQGVESFEDQPVSQMRKTIAKRLSESKSTAPHFYLTMEVDMDRLMDARESINRSMDKKLSINDFVIKASAAALRMHPKVNSSWRGDSIRVNHHVHIGVAVAVEDGLLVPVVRFADEKTLSKINEEVKQFAAKAKDKKLQPADWEGNTFTISNLGMFGIDEFTAIINTPDAAIMAVGAVKQQAVVKGGQVVPGNVMKVTLSCDHRVVDGASGAAFLKTFKGFMENPVLLLGQNTI